ncbi:MAG: pyridoxamine 5'-phosphate oxidase family protein, partial [Desulfobacterota bacterium]|nr:pyridoxamine 5'-phosphate oxidase family protein [Thermodesulfobacteriota bacterium]
MKSQKNKSKAEIKRAIIEFLNATSGQIDPKPGKKSCGIRHRNCLVLATCADNKPRATVLEFFNEGMTLYIFGEPGGKIGNIKRNPIVSAVVYEQPLDHSKFQRSLQLFGTAE